MYANRSNAWLVLGSIFIGVMLLSACAQQLAGREGGELTEQLVTVGFTSRDHDPTDDEVRAMVDEVIAPRPTTRCGRWSTR
jgi:hypothetical protein